jgi:hypothetical protein
MGSEYAWMALAVVLVGIAIHGTVGADFKIERTQAQRKELVFIITRFGKTRRRFAIHNTGIHLH